jgi:amino acid transporter
MPDDGTTHDLPETPSYRLKRRLLGKPLATEDLHSERLGKPVALAVLSSDVMSSCAYGSESILRILIPAVGLGAFVLVTPVTGLLLLVLGLVCLCYRQVVLNYPVSGGSYVVSRENFGFTTAQIPGAALLLSYVLTVAVSVAAGVDAVISAFPALKHYPVELSLGCVLLLTFGNLRGIREAGRVFAVPTYWFFASMALLVGTGVFRLLLDGRLHHYPLHASGHVVIGTEGTGLLLGASVFLFLRGFANGGSAMTGMEAISNAVPVFREPTVRNARTTLVLMASILGAMFLSVSIFAALTHAVPFSLGTPTVLSQIGRAVFGSGAFGSVAYLSLQLSTALILILGANTSYNGFPLLVNFIATDAYLPRPLRTRGHRLVYSNGICALTVVSGLLLVATGAQVASLIPLYACTVFTGFTMAGAGMTKFHWTHPSPGRPHKLFVAASTFVACFVVTLIFVVTEFTRGAWLVVICIPMIVLLLTRTNRRYTEERRVLAEDSASASSDAPMLRKQLVLVLVDTLDLATARAVRLARSLSLTGEVRAVHFVLDRERAKAMAENWGELGRWRIPLELIECPDRRLTRAVTEMVAEIAVAGDTEVVLVLPQRLYPGVANRLLHGNTAERLVEAVSTVPNVSATVAPFDVARHLRRRKQQVEAGVRTSSAPQSAFESAAPAVDGDGVTATPSGVEIAARRVGALRASRPPRAVRAHKAERVKKSVQTGARAGRIGLVDGATPIGDLEYRQRGRIAGRVHSMQVQPWSGVQTLECTVVDGSGAIKVVFLGRRTVPGLEAGARLIAEGMVGKHGGVLAIINPAYELLAAPSARARPEVS